MERRSGSTAPTERIDAPMIEMETEIIFSTAKNGSQTCTANGLPFHSRYNPEREAEQFAASVPTDFTPSFIFITEPALSYCAAHLKKVFPDTKLCALRYCRAFSISDHFFDRTFTLFAENDTAQFEDALFSYMGEEGICACRFLSWLPSAKIFPEQEKAAWQSIKNVLLKSRAALATHSYFASRWIKNAVAFCLTAKRTARIRPGSIPVIIAASGLSLQDALSPLKKVRAGVFLIAVSSAALPLLNAGILPDLVIATDGGFWAHSHLEILARYPDIPIAVSAEAACPKNLLRANTVIPLEFPDGFESRLAAECGFTSVPAERNGTVSGTALQLALSITDNAVFLCGLDLAPSPGMQHCRPNRLEQKAAAQDFRLMPKENRLTHTRFHSESLEIYRQWFSIRSSSFSDRVYRLSNHFDYPNRLGSIEDVDFHFLQQKMQNAGKNKPIAFESSKNVIDLPERCKKISAFINENAGSEEWLHQLFPAEYLSWKKSAENRPDKWEILEKKNRTLVMRLKEKLNAL